MSRVIAEIKERLSGVVHTAPENAAFDITSTVKHDGDGEVQGASYVMKIKKPRKTKKG